MARHCVSFMKWKTNKASVFLRFIQLSSAWNKVLMRVSYWINFSSMYCSITRVNFLELVVGEQTNIQFEPFIYLALNLEGPSYPMHDFVTFNVEWILPTLFNFFHFIYYTSLFKSMYLLQVTFLFVFEAGGSVQYKYQTTNPIGGCFYAMDKIKVWWTTRVLSILSVRSLVLSNNE